LGEDVFLSVFARATSSPDKNFFIKTAFIFLYFKVSTIVVICISAMRIFGRYRQPLWSDRANINGQTETNQAHPPHKIFSKTLLLQKKSIIFAK